MANTLEILAEAIRRWRSKQVEAYWVRVDYIGSALNRMGNHTLTFADGKLWHSWHDEWREIKPGSDFWLFSVPGAFAWARDMIHEVGGAEDSLQLKLNPDFGYVEFLRVKMPERDAANFTFEVKAFGAEVHPEFEG